MVFEAIVPEQDDRIESMHLQHQLARDTRVPDGSPGPKLKRYHVNERARDDSC